MNILYFEPLSRALQRMKRVLFQPFELRKWFAVGFTAFLAGLTDCGGHGGGGSGWRGRDRGGVDWEEVLAFPQQVWEWLLEHPGWFALIGFVLLVIFLLVVLLIWLSSRGKFMFLDNVVHNRALVKIPWYEYRREGNSLFLWSLSFTLVVSAILITYLIQCYGVIYSLYDRFGEPEALILPAVWMVLGFVVILALAAFVELLLTDFVVPIMYKFRIKSLKAWRVFLPLFSARLFHFLGYGLFVLALTVLIVIAIIVAGFLTCCIGFLLLLIPYINAVVLLPVSVTLRAFSVEFLEQLGPEFQIFPRGEPEIGDAAHATS